MKARGQKPGRLDGKYTSLTRVDKVQLTQQFGQDGS